MTIQQCKYVLKIAQCGSFNEAAKQLFVAQSSLSVSVKTLEQELNIKIFERSGNGVFLTEEGTEFIRYARQIAQQSDFVMTRYAQKNLQKRLYIATQHYDFVADTFARLLNKMQQPFYRLSIHELPTYDVIQQTETACCDMGIIALKGSDYGVMERYINKKGLAFTPVFKTRPHVYIRREHPLAGQTVITAERLKDYPCLSYEQGEHNNSFFTEELGNPLTDKQVQISDRASLMNILLETDGYTIGTGVMPSALNMGRIVSVPYESDDDYTVGYLLREDRTPSALTKEFMKMLKEDAQSYRE